LCLIPFLIAGWRCAYPAYPPPPPTTQRVSVKKTPPLPTQTPPQTTPVSFKKITAHHTQPEKWFFGVLF
ncbi:hypothetical protein, partial [Enterobacter sichuanensis]